METTLTHDTVTSDFVRQVEAESGQNVNLCYQCGKCAAGCPVAYAMDLTPTQIIHAVRLGLEDLVFGCKTIWLCATCETCTTRCPQEIDIARVIDAVRILAQRAKAKPAVREVRAFYRATLLNMRMFGRMFELGMIADLKLRTLALFKDMKLGMNMFLKGKLNMVPPMEFGASRDVRRIFKRVKKIDRRRS